MTIRNAGVMAVQESVVASSVDTDGSGQTVVTLGGLRQIESPADATAQAAGGYMANVVGVDGNDVTVEVRENASAAGEFPLVTDTSDVTDLHVNAEGQ